MTTNEKTKLDQKEGYYKTNQLYSITINPSDKYQFFGKEKRFKKFKNFLYESFLSFKWDYNLVIEISEPRGFHISGYSGPRLHAHGVMSFSNKLHLSQFLLNDFYQIQRHSALDVDTIDNIHVWMEYMTKQDIFKSNVIKTHTYIKDCENQKRENKLKTNLPQIWKKAGISCDT